jgi:acetyl/propionyl-CoA carboxylase alpha subunit
VPLLPGATLEGDDEADWHHHAEEVGYPLLVKASAGGGGKGMRLIEERSQLSAGISGARREAASSFGDPTVFLERYLRTPRHVEVQVLVDRHGNVAHLFDRDCSLQRRHQKVVEEAPAPNLSDGLRARMQKAAIALAGSIGYEGVGTLEFLVVGEEFFFLEMNTRLQVEHPVTEEITGLDLVRLQIEIAAGASLPFTQEDLHQHGHAIEVRLYAEDPARDYLPSVGFLTDFEPPTMDGIRFESGVRSGSEVSSHYDPMLAKVIAHASTRAEAARRLAKALRRLRLTGLRTNRGLLVATLETRGFLDVKISTAFFADHPEVLTPAIPPDVIRHASAALAYLLRERDHSGRPTSSIVPAGWRSLPAVPQTWKFHLVDGSEIDIALPPPGRAASTVSINGEAVDCAVEGIYGSRIDFVLGGIWRQFRVSSTGESHFVSSPDWQVELKENSRFPSSNTEGGAGGTTSPLPGTVVVIEVEPGDLVQEGDLLLVLEAMKMEHRILADVRGTVSAVLVSAGDRVDAHQPLITIEREGDQDVA